MGKIRKHILNKWVLAGVILITLFILFVLNWLLQLSAITINGKKYLCFLLQKDDRTNLVVLANLVSDITDGRDRSMKNYEIKLNNCGTEKEYQLSPETEELIPPDIQALLDEYNRTKPYTIKDFQECRELWMKDKQSAENDFNSQIEKWNSELNKLLSKKNCHLVKNN